MNQLHLKQSIIILHGMTGAGKTTTRKILSQRIPDLVTPSMDEIKWAIPGFERTSEFNAIARKKVFELAKEALGQGKSVCIDHPIKVDGELQQYEALAREFSVSIYKFQLSVDDETAFVRVMERQKDRPLDRRVPEDRIRRNIELNTSYEKWGFAVIDTTQKDPEKVVLEIMQELSFESNEIGRETKMEAKMK